MQRPLKQSTSATIKLGPFINPADGTAATGLTITQADVRLSKNGGDFAQKNDATSATHDEGGMYDVPLNSTDTNTCGILTVLVNESGAAPIALDFVVLQANVYDSLIAGTDYLEAHPGKFEPGTEADEIDLLKRDGTTVQATRTLTTNASADPITGAV